MVTEFRPDATASFLAQGYEFIGSACGAGDSAEVRLLGRRTVLVRGREAAEKLYDESLFRRAGALPMRAQRTLTGVGGVQGLDDEAHRWRKQLFVDLLDERAAAAIAQAFVSDWRGRLDRERGQEVSVLASSSLSLCAAVSEWAGVPVRGRALADRTRDLHAMIESAARVGPAHWAGLLARYRAERGLARTISDVRERPESWPPSPVRTVALHHDEFGVPLPERVAAVEVLNLLRPTVAIGRFVAFAAHALATHPGLAERLSDPALRRSFAHEVRRFYPFFPAVAAIARTDVTVGGRRIASGTRVLLDLYGTDRHPRECPRAGEFVADRYPAPPGPFDLIPQGGGDVRVGHRCPGEAVTVAVIEASIDVLADVRSATQQHPVDTRSIPTAPAGGMLVVPQAPVSQR